MKKNLFITIVVLALSIVSCKNESEESYDFLQQQIHQFDENQINPTLAENIINQIDTHLNKFPNFQKNKVLYDFKKKALIFIEKIEYQQLINQINGLTSENLSDYESTVSTLNEIKQSLLSYTKSATISENIEDAKSRIKFINQQLENIGYQQLINQINEINNKNFADYETAISNLNEIKQTLLSYSKSATISENIEDAKSRVEFINQQLESVNMEQSEFYNIMDAPDISVIQNFLNKYPNTVMRNTLYERIEVIYLSDFMTSINFNPQTIKELNESINRAKKYNFKFRKAENLMKITEFVTQLEQQRRIVLEGELNDKLRILIYQMENEAKTKALREHDGSVFQDWSVDRCSAIGNNPEQIGYSQLIERTYVVKIKGSATGGLFGYDRRELKIIVTGRIEGDSQQGVTFGVTGSSVESDVSL
ncbi:hypothetical protein ACI760_09910 [Capnocytophaga canimorsus]|uniref:hypothetical protein n=1 Tax=Capnocytophaga canimorsus TaxID=28188 RepID=UPI00385F9B31